MERTKSVVAIWISIGVLLSCAQPEQSPDIPERETLSRTGYTDRVVNFFDYDPLRAGQGSHFLIRLTDLSNGTPVGDADVVLTVRREDPTETVVETTAEIGEITGVYTADLAIPEPGSYEIEFRITNQTLDERIVLDGFQVE